MKVKAVFQIGFYTGNFSGRIFGKDRNVWRESFRKGDFMQQ